MRSQNTCCFLIGGTGILRTQEKYMAAAQQQDTAHRRFPFLHTWRPGMRPQVALILGGITAFFALLLTSVGLLSLLLGIIDSTSSPVRITGSIMQHSTPSAYSVPRLTIRIQTLGFPPSITPVVPADAFRTLLDGSPVTLYYTPNLHTLYALSTAHAYYLLPGSSKSGNPFGAGALLLIGLALLPYPARLASWGWRDLMAERRGQRSTDVGRILTLRRTGRTETGKRIAQPGLTAPGLSTSYHLVLLLTDSEAEQETVHFTIHEEQFQRVHTDMFVCVTYSPNLHYIYALEPVA